MLARMPSSAFGRWMAYARMEPFGEGRADLRVGILASLIANIHRNTQERPDPFEPKDFMPDFDPQRHKRSLGERVRAAFSSFMRRVTS